MAILRKSGMDDSWKCTSMEANIDSRYHRIDCSYAVQLIEGLILKVYQHGHNARIEIADRRNVPMREIMNFFHTLANTIDGQGIIRQQKSMDERITRCERKASQAITIAAKVRDEPGSGPTPSKKKAPQPGFTTAANLRSQETKQESKQEE